MALEETHIVLDKEELYMLGRWASREWIRLDRLRQASPLAEHEELIGQQNKVEAMQQKLTHASQHLEAIRR